MSKIGRIFFKKAKNWIKRIYKLYRIKMHMGTLRHILFGFYAWLAKRFVRFKPSITILGIKIL